MTDDANKEIEDFQKTLQATLGDQHVPDGSPGDLSDLLGTLEDAISLLKSLRGFPRDQNPSTLLHRIEIMLENDIPMICADLIPAIKSMRMHAYDLLAEQSPSSLDS